MKFKYKYGQNQKLFGDVTGNWGLDDAVSSRYDTCSMRTLNIRYVFDTIHMYTTYALLYLYFLIRFVLILMCCAVFTKHVLKLKLFLTLFPDIIFFLPQTLVGFF